MSMSMNPTVRLCALAHDVSACTVECPPLAPAFLAVDAPARVARPVRETYRVAESDLVAFRAEARHAGLTIVRSAPTGAGYAVTVEHAR